MLAYSVINAKRVGIFLLAEDGDKMTDIREGLLKIENCNTDVMCPSGQGISDDPCAECRTNQILIYLHAHGVVRKVEGELPKNEVREVVPGDIEKSRLLTRVANGYYAKAQQAMLAAGYTLTEDIDATETPPNEL